MINSVMTANLGLLLLAYITQNQSLLPMIRIAVSSVFIYLPSGSS